MSTGRIVLLAAACVPVLPWAAGAAASASDPRVKPGARFTLEFPDLGKTWNNDTSKMEVFIPEDYAPGRRFALFAWFHGGYGNHSVGPGPAVTGRKRFVCIGLPYRHPESGAGGWSKTPWSYYRTMLDELEKLVPNTDPAKRIAGGFSSGGTAVVRLIGESSEFRDYFYGFMPGGAGWPMGGLDKIRDRPMLVHCGDKDSRFSSLRRLYEDAKREGARAEFLVFEGVGHKMPREYYSRMLEWMEREVVFAAAQKEIDRLRTVVMTARDSGPLGDLARLKAEVAGGSFEAKVQELIEKINSRARTEFDKVVASIRRAGAGRQVRALEEFVRTWRGASCEGPACRMLEAAEEGHSAELAAKRAEDERKAAELLEELRPLPEADPAVSRAPAEPDASCPEAGLRRKLGQIVRLYPSTAAGREAKEVLERYAAAEKQAKAAARASTEGKARAKLRLARNYARNGMYAQARSLLESIIQSVPATDVAREAQKELRKLRY